MLNYSITKVPNSIQTVKIDFEQEYSSTHKIIDKSTQNGRAILIMNKLFDGKPLVRPDFVGATIQDFLL